MQHPTHLGHALDISMLSRHIQCLLSSIFLTTYVVLGLGILNIRMFLFLSLMMQELRAGIAGCQAYDVHLVTTGSSYENGTSLPLNASDVQRIRSASPQWDILHQAPAETDLEGDPCEDGVGSDASMWARTSLPAFLELISVLPVDLVVAVRYSSQTLNQATKWFSGLTTFTCARACNFYGVACRVGTTLQYSSIRSAGRLGQRSWTSITP